MKQKADKIFYNGTVYTVNNGFQVVDAFAIQKGKIIAVGSIKDILNGYESSEKIDLEGKTVFPGFIDAHCHFMGYGMGLTKCDLVETKSFDEVVNTVVEYSKMHKFEWIIGRGWDQNDWAVKNFPSKEKLDSLFPHTPVLLSRVDGHAVLCNTEALNRARIDVNTKVSGGEIHQKNGKLTGILVDNAVDIVSRVIPPFTEEVQKQALLNAQQNCFAVGLTTVDDAGLGKDAIMLIDKLQKNGDLKMRMYVMISDDTDSLDYFYRTGPYKTDHLNVSSIKTYSDGALGSRGACLLLPYADQPNHSGFLLHQVGYFDSLAKKAREHNFQLCTHAIGDSAVRIVLNTYAKNLEKGNDRRWRVEHAQVVDQNDLKTFGEYNIIPSVQTTHATSDMYWAGDRLGKERVKTAYAYKDLMKYANGKLVLGTDFPVEDINPLYTFYAATERKDLKGYPEGGFQPENKISREDALRGMTIWAAYSNFEEKEKGSIEIGKFADFIILDSDIIKIDGSKIPSVKVEATYLGGEKVFEKIH